jgi:dipeptidyl aminopeptidase/acylaminoacyl peptidase
MVPAGRKSGKPLPLVLFVHGGPHARDSWGFNGTMQWLANRGYAVLQVNYRGSTGFGKSFLNAGNGEWAGKMHDDLLDAVQWAIDEKIADPKKICIFGGSYGGYATLVGLTFTPDVFACGVDIVGPSSLETLLESIPDYWKPAMEELKLQIGGGIETQAGRSFLKSRSPLTFAHRIAKPLLIGQGEHDPRVKRTESDQIVKVMKEKGIPVTYIVYPDEGHGFIRPENKIAFYGVMEHFLAENLGGRMESLGDDLKKSSADIVEGSLGK